MFEAAALKRVVPAAADDDVGQRSDLRFNNENRKFAEEARARAFFGRRISKRISRTREPAETSNEKRVFFRVVFFPLFLSFLNSRYNCAQHPKDAFPANNFPSLSPRLAARF